MYVNIQQRIKIKENLNKSKIHRFWWQFPSIKLHPSLIYSQLLFTQHRHSPFHARGHQVIATPYIALFSTLVHSCYKPIKIHIEVAINKKIQKTPLLHIGGCKQIIVANHPVLFHNIHTHSVCVQNARQSFNFSMLKRLLTIK